MKDYRETYFREYTSAPARFYKDANGTTYVLHADDDETWFFSIGELGEGTSDWLFTEEEVNAFIAAHGLTEYHEGQTDKVETFAQD